MMTPLVEPGAAPALARERVEVGAISGQSPTAPVDRAFAAGAPSLVNVLTDPVDAYPRSSNLG